MSAELERHVLSTKILNHLPKKYHQEQIFASNYTLEQLRACLDDKGNATGILRDLFPVKETRKAAKRTVSMCCFFTIVCVINSH